MDIPISFRQAIRNFVFHPEEQRTHFFIHLYVQGLFTRGPEITERITSLRIPMQIRITRAEESSFHTLAGF